MLTAEDSDLIGEAGRMDAMGILAIWSIRGRDLVPHLTEQTTSVRGFQMLIEAYRLWDLYEPNHPEHAGKLDDFFQLIEQAFARIVGWYEGDWNLPGARRVRARLSTKPQVSLVDTSWHLLNNQKSNGVWGLYRGAARRAGLLQDDMSRLSVETMEEANLNPGIFDRAQDRLFDAIEHAMNDGTVDIPVHWNNAVTRDFYHTFRDVPLLEHLYEMLIERHELNQKLARLLSAAEKLDHRTVLANLARKFSNHKTTIRNVVDCENLLCIVEAVFLWLCASRGKHIDAAVSDLPVELDDLRSVHQKFEHSGMYGEDEDMAKVRHRRFCDELDLSTKVQLAHSILAIHEAISEERNRTPWVWVEEGVLSSDVEVEKPDAREFETGLAWRNDYYLKPLQSIVKEFDELRG